MKKIGPALLCLLMACGVSAMALYGIWNQYNPIAITGSNIQTGNTDVRKVTEQQSAESFKQCERPFVPFGFRIRDKRVKTIEALNEEEGLVQLDYEFRPVSDNPYVTSYYTTALQENGWYITQVILQLEKTLNGYTVKNKISPVRYQIQTDLSLHEPPTTHYATADRKEAYTFSQSQLYAAYDAGKNFIGVPIPYEDIVGANNSTCNELLPIHRYVVSGDFTAFVCYDEAGSYLQYSGDMGKIWEKNRIISRTCRGDTLYLPRTENSCYITLAIDRLLGHEYYSTFKSSDLKIWRQLSGRISNEKGDIIFLSDETACIGAGASKQGNSLVYYTEDDGNTYTTLTIPAHEVEILGSSFKPFIQMEYIYQERGITYTIVAQGTDDNHIKNNTLIKGRYKPKDGINFTFDGEVNGLSTLAGQAGEPI